MTCSKSRELEDACKRARGEPITRKLCFEVTEDVYALWTQRHVAMRVQEPTLDQDHAFARMVQGGDEGAGGGRARVVLHCAVPADAPVTPGAAKAQAALDAAAASVAVIVQTPGGPVALPRKRLVEALCCAEINDVRDGPARVTNTVPPKTERYVRDRDQGRCRVPGCENLNGLQVHHVGGRHVVGHDPDFMCLLCTCHHGMCHEGLLQIDAVDGGFVFTAADGSPPAFVPFDVGVAVPALPPVPVPAVAPAPVPASAFAPRPVEEPVVAPQAVEDAVLALVVLEWKKREARDAVRRAVAALTSRAEAIDAGALTAEALRQSPGPSSLFARLT